MSDPAATPPDAEYTTFQRLHEVFDRVSEMPAEKRDAEITRLTADAPGLAEDVRALLEHSARADSPLDNGALRLREDVDPRLPRIEGFRIERRIGRGGSATVYLALQERAEFTREVALKVEIKLVDIMVTSVRLSGTGGDSTESTSLTYGGIESVVIGR